MPNMVIRSCIFLLLVLIAALIFSCGKDNGMPPEEEVDFWRQTNGPYGGAIRSLTVNSNGHIFAGTYVGGIFRSEDNGDSWTAVNNGLTNLYMYALVINSSGHIFAGTNYGGAFKSEDNGDSWEEVNTGLMSTNIRALAINSSGYIFAGTAGNGVYCSTKPTN